MNLYEIVLMCPFCETELSLGIVQADSVFDAKQKAIILWPSARYEEMVPRIQHLIDAGFRSIKPVARAS